MFGMGRPLTLKQQKFVEAFAGNATEAARLAGYDGDDATLRSIGSENLTKHDIIEAIRAREAQQIRPLVASRYERQRFWTELMNNPALTPAERLRASELLGKSEADFTEKVKHEGTVSIAVVDPYAKPKSDG